MFRSMAVVGTTLFGHRPVDQKARPDIDTGLEWPARAYICWRKVWFTAEGRRQSRATTLHPSRSMDHGHARIDSHALRHSRRETDLHNKRKLCDGQHPGEGHAAADDLLRYAATTGFDASTTTAGRNQPRMDWNETIIPVGKATKD